MSELTNVEECPVCFDELNDLNTSTGKQCQHKLCSICFDKLTHSTNKCPMCRAYLISKRGFKRIKKRMELSNYLNMILEDIFADHVRSQHHNNEVLLQSRALVGELISFII